MNHPTKPGQKCRVIGGRMPFNGEGKSPNDGKLVVTVSLHDEQAGVEMENVWHCRSFDGSVLQTYYGAGTEADFLECWLEVCPPEKQTPKILEKELDESLD
jgi:hypothetical protein